MKFFVPLVCCLAFVRALPGGQSVSSRSQDDHGNYEFGYDIVDEHGAQNGRQEKGDAHGNKVGSYMIKDLDGRARRVDYVADAHGFRATIGTNEPGTATSEVGAAVYHSSAPVLTLAPAKLLAAPALHAPVAYAAPLAYAHSAPVLRAAPYLAGPAIAKSYSYGAPLLGKGYGAPALLGLGDSWNKGW